jgi:hypothetical protein
MGISDTAYAKDAYGNPSTDPPYDVVLGLKKNLVNGFDIQNYHRLRREGKLLPMTPFDHVEENIVHTRPLYQWSSTTDSSEYIRRNAGSLPHVPSGFDFGPYQPGSLQGLVTTAAGKINAGISDPLTFLAELTSLRRMFSNLAELLGRKMKDLKVGHLGNPADRWLEVRYGWRPLIGEIERFYDALTSTATKRKRLSEQVGDTQYTSSYSLAHVYEYTEGRLEVFYYDFVTIGTRGNVIADFGGKNAFQINPLVTAWEIVPLSFLIDWLIDIGSQIQAASFLLNNPDYVASYGYRIDYEREISSLFTPNPGFTSNTYEEGHGKGYLEVRQPTTVSLLPPTPLKLDALRGLDIVALMRQRLRR